MHRASSPSPDGSSELCLRFPCAGCQELLFVPVEQLRRLHFEQCPQCHRAVEFPAIDENTRGYKRIFPRVRTKKIDCPKCRARLQVPAGAPGSQHLCPACQAVLVFQLVPQDVPQAAASPGSPRVKATPRPQRETSPQQEKAPQSPNHAPLPPLDRQPNRAEKAVQPPSGPKPVEQKRPAPKAAETPTEITGFDAGTTPQPVVYSGQSAASSAGRGGSELSSSPRLTFWLLYFGLHFVPPIVGIGLFVLTHNTSLAGLTGAIAGLTCVWLVFGFYPSRLLARFITPLIVTTFKCPGCAEQFPAVSRWTCGCGYTDHRERHALSFSCPKCSGVLGYVDCEQCGATMIIR